MPDQSTGVCAARTNALVCNIHELITELEERIEAGEPFDNPKLTRTAERTDEETGIAALTDLLSRYPVLPSDVLSDEPIEEIEPKELAPPQIIDLDEWFVSVEAEPTQPSAAEHAQKIETTEAAWALPAFYFARPSQAVREVEEIQLALDFG